MNLDRFFTSTARLVLARLIRSQACQSRACQSLGPIRARRAFQPSLRSLEARYVLNASAELNAIGQLLISGTGTAETVQMEIDANGNLTLRDEANELIGITGNPGLNPTDPLPQQAITSNQIQVALDGGDDVFVAQLPSSLSVTLLDGGGDDSASLTLTDRGPVRTATYSITAETITVEQDSPTIRLVDDRMALSGDVFIGSEGISSTIDLGIGDLSIDGRLLVRGDTNVIGDGSQVMMTDAVATATSDNVDLRFELGDTSSANLFFGGADDSGGSRIENLEVGSAANVLFSNQATEVVGDLRINSQSGMANIDTAIDANQIIVNVNNDVNFSGGLTATDAVSVNAGVGKVTFADNINASNFSVSSDCNVSLQGASVVTDQFAIDSTSGTVAVASSVQANDIIVETNNEVVFSNSVTALDMLAVNAADGAVAFGGNVDATAVLVTANGDIGFLGETTTAEQIALTSGAGVVQIDSAIKSNDITVDANNDVNFASTVTVANVLSVDAGDGAVAFGGNVEANAVHVTANGDIGFLGDTTIAGQIGVTSVAGVVLFESAVQTNDLTVNANNDVNFSSTVTVANVLSVDAGDGAVTFSGNVEASEVLVTANGDIGFLGDTATAEQIAITSVAGVVLFESAVQTNDLTVNANNDVTFLSTVSVANSIIVNAGDGIVTFAANVDADELNLVGNGDVRLIGDATRAVRIAVDSGGGNVIVEGDFILDEGIAIIAGGGNVDLGASHLTSDFAFDVLTIEDAGAVTLGVLEAAKGNLVIGTWQDIAGPIEQANETAIHVDRLSVSSQNLVDLSQLGNLIGTVESLMARGDVRVFDGNEGISIGQVNSGGGGISIETSGVGAEILLKDSLISVGGNIVLNALGSIIMQPDASVAAAFGTITFHSFGDVSLTGLSTLSAADDAITVTANVSGSIVDAGDSLIDIDANFGKVTLSSLFGIGAENAIETAAGGIEAVSNESGAIRIVESDAVRLESIIATDGPINVSAGGTIDAIHVSSVNVLGSDDPLGNGLELSRDIRLTSSGGGDIYVGEILAAGPTDVVLNSDDDILARDNDSIVLADDLSLESRNQNADGDNAIELNTTIETLSAIVGGVNRGDLEIRESDSIELAANDTRSDNLTVETSNGEVRVIAEHDITISDQRPQSENVDFAVTPKLLAMGENGRVHLDAGNASGDTMTLGNGASIVAQQTSLGSVQLDAAEFVFGEQIEIRTGAGIGVARVFSPRPIDDVEGTAFFDSTGVTTNRLEQANENDGTGILTVFVGQEGERGLTLNIDWGAETARYQQEDLLAGNQSHRFSHVYLEQDILDTQLNGRRSATAPLEVRFSVRHHESIIVTGNTITQGVLDPDATPLEQPLPIRPGETEQVTAGVVSATDNDNPLRPDLNASFETNTVSDNASLTHLNGHAQFIIPSLTVPVAFFPVRDVLPEPEPLEVFARTETTSAPKGASIEATEASATSSASREEYFQIRVLSPDPDGDDLAAPERLPDAVLEGDKLKQLFADLPDGRYAIEYVLGDGNERTIIEVDIRDGEPIVPGEEIEGGYLKLKLLDELPGEQVPEENQLESSAVERSDSSEHVNTERHRPFDSEQRFSRASRFAHHNRQHFGVS
ncbi:hypothetical protein CA13_59890 [Planctomycetes bacterium CA13]|uniref:Uncharacterized protein n=1 Tax=Novipirellula herctigrandis TaxID=2527986 RepID=A0A5C5ZBG7_9BACT|nr:hypothetical protein CA13_59890 [Planctomycetes bacterium CA13]